MRRNNGQHHLRTFNIVNAPEMRWCQLDDDVEVEDDNRDCTDVYSVQKTEEITLVNAIDN